MIKKRQRKYPKRSKQSFGQFGEEYASILLRNKGYKIITKNFKCKLGEIDIIATKDDCLIFVEVKTRYSDKFGSPVEAVTPFKLHHIKKTGEYFSLMNPKLPKKLRIEVVALEIREGYVKSEKIVKVE